MFVAISAALLARSHFKKYNFLSHTFFCTWINKWCIKFTLSKTWLLLTHWDVFFLLGGGLSQQVICNSLNTGMFFGRWSPVSCRPLVEAVRREERAQVRLLWWSISPEGWLKLELRRTAADSVSPLAQDLPLTGSATGKMSPLCFSIVLQWIWTSCSVQTIVYKLNLVVAETLTLIIWGQWLRVQRRWAAS